MCDRISVMYGGEIVESGPTDELLAQPRHPYTQDLLNNIHIHAPCWRRRHGSIVASPPTNVWTPIWPPCYR
jgi:peptide/nickel transport system ATP-binding protein